MNSDSQILLIQERLRNDLTRGESHFREFKSAYEGPAGKKRMRKVNLVAKDIGETLVAFANADGGTLFIGVEDDGTVTGTTYPEDALKVLCNAPRTHVHADTPLSQIRPNIAKLNDKVVLVFNVQKGTRTVHLTSDGRCLQRRDTDTVPVSSEAIQFERHEQVSREYDRRWVDGGTAGDLHHELLERVAETVSPGMSAEKCLQSLGLAEFVGDSLRLRTAAFLLFASDVRKWHPRSEIRILRISGTELLTGVDYNVTQDESYSGNALELLSVGWELIRQYLVQKRLAGGTFQFQAAYPEDACREALVNAIAHRDYSIEGRAIEVLVFNDRLEIRNPGRLLSTVNLAELKRGIGFHDSRNTYVARVLRELGYMQEMGEGIRRIQALMNGHELAPPDIASANHTFTITFSHRNVFNPTEQRWLDAFSDFNLSRDEKLIVLLGRGRKPISAAQIWETLDIVDTEEYRQIVEQLQTKGLWSLQTTSNAARTMARRRGISPREVPRFAIRPPDIAQNDQREVVNALVSLGPFDLVSHAYCQKVIEKLGGQNIYRNAVRMRHLLRWLELVNAQGRPTERLSDLWAKNRNIPISLDLSKAGVEAKQAGSLVPPRDIYVGNLDFDTTEGEVRSTFAQSGTVVSVIIPKDYLTGQSRGYAFVRMSDSATSLKAFTELNGHQLRNRPLRLGWAFRQSNAR